MQQIFDKLTRDFEMCLQNQKNSLDKISTGRAHPRLLNQISVDCYGAQMPLSQLANISAEDSRTLLVVPFDKANIAKVEKAILTSNMGFNPQTVGVNIRIPLPVLTEERRKDLVKLVGEEAEKARVAIRKFRREANAELKKLQKNKDISEDDFKSAEKKVQKSHDEYIDQVNNLAKDKENSIMTI